MKQAWRLSFALAMTAAFAVIAFVAFDGTAQAALDAPLVTVGADAATGPNCQESSVIPSASDSFTDVGRALVPVEDKFYLLGEFNTAAAPIFNSSSGVWTLNEFSGTTLFPPERQAYAATAHDNEIWVFGGQTPSGDKLDDVWRFDPKTDTWDVAPQETRPPGRSGHTAVSDGSKFLVYGGDTTNPTFPTSAVWEFDPVNGYWGTRGSENREGARPGHVSGYLNNQLYLVGGANIGDDAFVQRVENNVNFLNVLPEPTSERPSPRQAQATAFDKLNNRIFIFGGEDWTSSEPVTESLVSSWSFDLGTKVWTRVPDLPQPLFNPVAGVWHVDAVPDKHGVTAPTMFVLIVGNQATDGRLVSYVFDVAEETYTPQPFPERPDALLIHKTALDVNGGALVEGDIIRYTIIVTNPHSVAISGVVISDAIPAHTTYVVDSDTPEADADANPLVWSNQTIAGSLIPVVRTYTFEVSVDPGVVGATIRNVACLTQPDVPQVCTVPVVPPAGGQVKTHIYLPLVLSYYPSAP